MQLLVRVQDIHSYFVDLLHQFNCPRHIQKLCFFKDHLVQLLVNVRVQVYFVVYQFKCFKQDPNVPYTFLKLNVVLKPHVIPQYSLRSYEIVVNDVRNAL